MGAQRKVMIRPGPRRHRGFGTGQPCSGGAARFRWGMGCGTSPAVVVMHPAAVSSLRLGHAFEALTALSRGVAPRGEAHASNRSRPASCVQ